MKMIKRLISCVVATAIVATLIAGCGNSNTSTDSATSTVAPVSTAAASTVEPQKDVTLTLWQTSADTYQSRLDMQANFQKENPKIKLNIVETPQGEGASFMSAVAAGNAPSCSTGGYPSIPSYAYQNALLPIDDFMAATPDFANFDKAQVDTFLINGKHYAVPGGKYVMTWTYNKKLFAEAGISAPPTTWDEFLADAKLLTIPEKQQYGFGILATVWGCWHFENWVWGAGGDLTKQNTDGTLELTFTDPAAIKAAEFYRTLRKEKVVQSDISKDYAALQKDFALGKSAIFFGGNVQQLVTMGGKAEDFGWFTFPVGPSGKAYTQSGGDASFITYTEDKDVAAAAWKYLMYAGSKDQLINQLKEQASKGGYDANQISPRTDVNPGDYGVADPDLKAVIDASNLISRPEFYGKGAVASYADDMVSSIFGDTSSDITKVFQAAQDKAVKDVETFNKGILEGKK